MDKRYKRRRKRKRKGPKFGILLLLFAALFFINKMLMERFVVPIFEKQIASNHSTQAKDESGTDELEADKRLLYYKEQLKGLLDDYPNVQTILDNIESYPENILELAIHNQETINFVVNYIKHGNLEQDENNISIDNYAKNEIPLFLQWDTKWGYYQYGDGLIATDGCGPTALSMVIVGLTGDTSANPKVIADYSAEMGYLANDNSTSWTLMSVGSKDFGIIPTELQLSENVILNCLKNGHPIIASMRKGDFTSTGHYIVMVGVSENGKLIINDSNSIKRSNELWTFDKLQYQIKNLWSFSNAN